MTMSRGEMTLSSRWWGGRGSLLLLVGIVAVAAAIRVHLFQGYIGTDDDEYAHFAYQMGWFQLDGYEGPGRISASRRVIAPTAVLFRLFGLSEWTLALAPLTPVADVAFVAGS